jgi:hypothetical protein
MTVLITTFILLWYLNRRRKKANRKIAAGKKLSLFEKIFFPGRVRSITGYTVGD